MWRNDEQHCVGIEIDCDSCKIVDNAQSSFGALGRLRSFRSLSSKQIPLVMDLLQGAKACTKCRHFKRHDQFNRDKQKTDGRASNCKECEKQRCTKYRQNNRHIWQRHYRNNEKAYKARSKQRRIDNPEEKLVNEQNRRAAKKQALPSWAKTKAMQGEFKRIAQHRQWLNEATGISHDIDHIVPLQSDFVCGLHVPWNLMILPKKDNNSKSAYWWPGQLDCQTGRGQSHQWWRELQHDVENSSQ